MFAAMRLASSLLSNFAADRPRFAVIIDISELLPVSVAHDEAVGALARQSMAVGSDDEAFELDQCLSLNGVGNLFNEGHTPALGSIRVSSGWG